MPATKHLDHAAYARKVKRMTVSELRFTLADCRGVLAVAPDCTNSGYYADEINYCAGELQRRLGR